MPSVAEAAPAPAPTMIAVERLTIGYGERVVLENLDFTIPVGQVFAIGHGGDRHVKFALASRSRCYNRRRRQRCQTYK